MAAKSAFTAAEQEIRELFGDYLEDNGTGAVLVLSETAASPIVRNALEKSFAALGFGDSACLYATLYPRAGRGAGEGGAESNPGANGGARLDPQAAFLLLEGIDPPFAICTDNAAAQLLEVTYKTQLPRNAATRVFGRAAVIFNDLSALLSTEKGKRTTWELLKALVN